MIAQVKRWNGVASMIFSIDDSTNDIIHMTNICSTPPTSFVSTRYDFNG
jgi:hypothetical protein